MPEKPIFRQLLQASTVGLNLVFSTFIGLAIGYGLDSLFNTSPWLTIIFLVIGIIAGFRELLRMAKKQDNGTDTKNT
jgi:ATP synthase protein I